MPLYTFQLHTARHSINNYANYIITTGNTQEGIYTLNNLEFISTFIKRYLYIFATDDENSISVDHSQGSNLDK